jgi:hypothetical protein
MYYIHEMLTRLFLKKISAFCQNSPKPIFSGFSADEGLLS